MKYLKGPPEKGMRIIDDFLSERLRIIKGKERDSLVMEFKEWIADDYFDENNVWTIPDLTDEGLCDFFRRAISKTN